MKAVLAIIADGVQVIVAIAIAREAAEINYFFPLDYCFY